MRVEHRGQRRIPILYYFSSEASKRFSLVSLATTRVWQTRWRFQGFFRKINAPLLINSDNFNLNSITNPDNICDSFHSFVIQLTNMDQTVPAGKNLYKSSKI